MTGTLLFILLMFIATGAVATVASLVADALSEQVCPPSGHAESSSNKHM
jgi:hypothetical protein